MRVGFIGLGAMGGRMARRLLDAGHDLVVWNRDAAKAAPLVGAGAAGAGTPAHAARGAEAVVVMVSDPAALVAVTAGADGVAAAAPGVVVQMSTVGPAATERLAAALPEDVGLLDAPVLGSVAEAEAGTLRIFAGGAREHLARVEPLLATLGTVLPVGPVGAGSAAKLVVNSTLFGVIGVLGEALALADGLGLAHDVAFEVLGTTPVAAQAERRRPAVESGDYQARFTLSLALKDADLILDAADATGVELRMAKAARGWLADAERAGRGGEDYAVVLEQIRKPGGAGP